MQNKTRVSAIALVTVAGLLGSAAPSLADGYERGVYAPRFSWSGFYVGINGGYGFSADDYAVVWNETNATLPFFGPATAGSLSPAGGFGGGQVGVNRQFGGVVLGLEADLQVSDISDTAAGSTTPYLAPGGIATVTSKSAVGSFGTLRPRIGFTWDRTLLYGTGGLAWGRVTHSMLYVDSFGFTGQDKTSSSQVGYAVGGGLEHAFSGGWSMKAEYQYINLGSHSYIAPELFGGATTAFAIHTNTDTDFHTVRLGLNWKWDDRRDAPLK
jgi:outer membrane immunogenic protein